MRLHFGHNANKCEICGKEFTEARNVKIHKLLHTNERLHKCDICGLSFTQSGNLKKHMAIHTGKDHIHVIFVGKTLSV